MVQDAGPGRLRNVHAIRIGDWVMWGHPENGDWGAWVIVTKLPPNTDPPNVVIDMRQVLNPVLTTQRFTFKPFEKLLRLREA